MGITFLTTGFSNKNKTLLDLSGGHNLQALQMEQERRYEIRRASTLVGGETKYQIIQNLETDRDRQTGRDRKGETDMERQTGTDRQGLTDRERQTGIDRQGETDRD